MSIEETDIDTRRSSADQKCVIWVRKHQLLHFADRDVLDWAERNGVGPSSLVDQDAVRANVTVVVSHNFKAKAFTCTHNGSQAGKELNHDKGSFPSGIADKLLGADCGRATVQGRLIMLSISRTADVLAHLWRTVLLVVMCDSAVVLSAADSAVAGQHNVACMKFALRTALVVTTSFIVVAFAQCSFANGVSSLHLAGVSSCELWCCRGLAGAEGRVLGWNDRRQAGVAFVTSQHQGVFVVLPQIAVVPHDTRESLAP